MNRLTLKSGEEIELNQAFNCDCLEFMKQLPDKSVGLIMVDPPYFEVKGNFDFIWDSFADYMKDVEKWAIECKRILADNGSMFWWGNVEKIAYTQVILDKYFKFENHITWRKPDSIQYQYYSVELSRRFNTHNERVLFYSNEVERTGLEEIKLNVSNFKTLREYFKKFQESTGLKKAVILKKFGGETDHCFRWGSSQWEMPKHEIYLKLCTLENVNGFRRKEYEDLRKEYEDLRRPFFNETKLEDVITHSQESTISRQYDHETIKAIGLIKKLLQTTTRKGDIVYSPFWGSGTDSVACHELGLNWIATELDKKHFKNAQERYTKETKQLLMDF